MPKDDVVQSVYEMLRIVTVFGDAHSLGAPAGPLAREFNELLARVKHRFRASEALRHISQLGETDTMVRLIARLAIVKGGVDVEVFRERQNPD